ncbi:MAG: NosD domain-containing protein [Bryobacteraceae bacterium]
MAQTGGRTQSVAMRAPYAYIGVGMQVVALDVSDPNSILQIGATGSLGGAVRDIALPAKPIPIRLPLARFARRPRQAPLSLAYVAAGEGGLYMGANFNWVRANLIVGNAPIGIQIAGGAGNRIEGNAFLGNTQNATDGGSNNSWDNGRTGNFWSDYTGKDANHDGIGDTPYPVPPSGTDRFPLMANPILGGTGTADAIPMRTARQ